MSGQSGGRIRLAELKDQLTCNLCHGYFIDATTIIECLHSFCRSCIVQYLRTNKYCPICEVQVHKSKPLLNIRPDHTLQDIVYKLVPGCYQNEMRCRREFYKEHPDAQTPNMSPEARGEPIESHIYSPDETLTLSLEYYNPNNINEGAVVPIDSTKDSSNSSVGGDKVLPGSIIYLRCPAAVTVFHLQKLMRGKHGLTDAHRVDVMYKEELLCSTYTLMDVMYIYHWRRKVPLRLSYRIFQSTTKRIKVSDDNPQYKELLNSAGISSVDPKEENSNTNDNNSNSTTNSSSSSSSNNNTSNSNNSKVEYKEVQLKISETGIMSVTGISNSPESKKLKPDDETKTGNKKSPVEIKEKVHLTGSGEQSSKDSKNVDNDSRKNSKNTETKLTNFNNNSTNSNNNNNNNNSNSGSATESTSKVETRDKSKNSVNIESKNSQMAGGSKIDSLSAKLQFQPKLGQVNHTYSKRTPKDKKTTADKALKKTDNKNADKNRNNVNTVGTNKSSNSQSKILTNTTSVSSSTTVTPTTSSSDSLNANTSIYSSPSVSISISTRRNSSPERNKESNSSKRRSNSGESSEKSSSSSSSSNVNTSQSNRSFSRQNNQPPVSENLSAIGLNISKTTLLNVGQSGSTYTVQDLVSNSGIKSPTKSISNQKNPSSSALLNNQEFNIPTTNQSISSGSSGSNNNIRPGSSSKGSLEISSVYSVPPCPDAIPISMMKPMPTVRKTEILAKGTNINEICAKIGNSGSKINDICAKIGENSKEKNKIERSRPEIPDLLKITKKTSDSINIKHIPNIPNVPIYTPSNSLDSKNMYLNKDNMKMSNNSFTIITTSLNTNTSSTIVNIVTSNISSPISSVSTSITPVTSQIPFQMSGRGSNIGSIKKTQSQSHGYKTLRDPPKSWNPSLSKNNYVAAKNQASKELQNQTPTSSSSSLASGSVLSSSPASSSTVTTSSAGAQGPGDISGKTIASKPAKIFKMRNVPRYLGNPASGVKPMYGLNNSSDNKDSAKEQQTVPSSSSSSSTTVTVGSTNNKNNPSGLSMTKIDPKTLSAIVSTNSNNNSCNSPIVSPPPYSPNARSYQNTPFSRTTGSPISPRNSPVNMLSTNPFIPSPTPNTNPRLIYSHFPPPYPDTSRFPNPLVRSPIGITPPPSAFHSSLPPSINKIYQRSSYIPQTTSTNYQGLTTQTPTVQRIPPTTHSSPKSSKSMASPVSAASSSSSTTTAITSTTVVTASTYNFSKSEMQTSSNIDVNSLKKNSNSNNSGNSSTCSSSVTTTTTTITTTSSNSNITTTTATTSSESTPTVTSELTNAFNLSKTADSSANYVSDLTKQSSGDNNSDNKPRNISIMATLNQNQKKMSDSSKKLKDTSGNCENNSKRKIKKKKEEEEENEDEDDDDEEDDDDDDIDDDGDDDDDDEDEDDDDGKKKVDKEKDEKKKKLDKNEDTDNKVNDSKNSKDDERTGKKNSCNQEEKCKDDSEKKANDSETSDKKKKKVKLVLNKSKNQLKSSLTSASSPSDYSKNKEKDGNLKSESSKDETRVKLNESPNNLQSNENVNSNENNKSNDDLTSTATTTATTTTTTSSITIKNQDKVNDNKSDSIIYPDSDKSSKDSSALRLDELNKSNEITKKTETRNKAES